MNKNQNKIAVYFLPGLAANSSIFKNIQLDTDQFEMHFLEWMIPFEDESISEYAIRFCKKINHVNAILVGVSFGGIIAQEMNLVWCWQRSWLQVLKKSSSFRVSKPVMNCLCIFNWLEKQKHINYYPPVFLLKTSICYLNMRLGNRLSSD